MLKIDNEKYIEQIYTISRELEHYKKVGPIRKDQRTSEELREALINAELQLA